MVSPLSYAGRVRATSVNDVCRRGTHSQMRPPSTPILPLRDRLLTSVQSAHNVGNRQWLTMATLTFARSIGNSYMRGDTSRVSHLWMNPPSHRKRCLASYLGQPGS